MKRSAESDTYLRVAASIGDTLARAAIWQEARCGFMGAWPEEGPGGSVVTTYRALGADLYGGTAGIGLFLAELAAATGESRYARTALGALRHAASRVDATPTFVSAGLYAGRPGIALALARASELLDAPDLLEAARRAAFLDPPSMGAEFDLVSGYAGAVVGLLALRQLLPDSTALETSAQQHADALIAAAIPEEDMCEWRPPTAPGTHGLTGLSHGASGVAVALLHMARLTGVERYRAAALGALAYERALFDPDQRNWPDLRVSPSHDPSQGPSFPVFWCHGAPGIALARLRILELGETPEVREEALAALATTRAWVTAYLQSGADWSLCHGLAGNAEIVLTGDTLLGGEGRRLALAVADAGTERYANTSSDWPCGVPGGHTPALFLGTAGIGRFYLRLACPGLPSLLLPEIRW